MSTSADDKTGAALPSSAPAAHLSAMTHWDSVTMMPPGVVEPGSEALAELGVCIKQMVANELPRCLNRLMATLNEWEAANLREMQCLAGECPAEAGGKPGRFRCEHWREQRIANDWQGFANLKTVVDLSRQGTAAGRGGRPLPP